MALPSHAPNTTVSDTRLLDIEQSRRMPSAGAGGSSDSLPGLGAVETVGIDPFVGEEHELAVLEEREELDEGGPLDVAKIIA